MVKTLLERFTKKNCKKQIRRIPELKKQLRKKVRKHMLNAKAAIILLEVELIKKI